MRFLKNVSVAFFAVSACEVNAAEPPKTVNALDLFRYSGRWYEIATFPKFFQKGCTCTRAEYTLADSKIEVKNRCLKGGDETGIDGKAWRPRDSEPGKLKVKFFWWQFGSDYWVFSIDESYSIAVVGDSKRDSLWFLSRTREVTPDQLSSMRDVAIANGFDLEKLVMTTQTNCDLHRSNK